VLFLQFIHQSLGQSIDPKEETFHLHERQTDQPYCSRIPTTKMVQLPRFLPHSRCTRRTDDYGSSMCEKPSDQRPPGTTGRRRSASPRAPGSGSARWRGSLKKTSSSEPKGISTPPRPPQQSSHCRALCRPLSLSPVVTATLSVARAQLLATNSGHRRSLCRPRPAPQPS
jgi:hypothetical protein